MNYSPKGMYIWDAWYMDDGKGLHMYHLQRTRNMDEAQTDKVQDCLGHAFTVDLIDWQELPPCLAPDSANPIDDCQPWTGSAVFHEGRSYLYYTMRGSQTECREQHIGLALSDDASRFTRYSGNPVITSDPRWYADVSRPTPGIVDCRDLVVVKDPGAKGWYGYFASRQPAATLPETSVVGCAYSEDLVHWKQQAPAYVSNRFCCVEVPDVFFMDGRWYMTCLTGNVYGKRHVFSDPNLSFGTIYLVADHPAGPFYELKDNVLLGAKSPMPLSVRSFMWEGERHILYTDRERINRRDREEVFFGTITTPKLLRTSGDTLQVVYCPRIEKKVKGECVFDWNSIRAQWSKPWGQIWPLQSGTLEQGDNIRLGNPNCWSVMALGQTPESFILEADVTLEGCLAAGFSMRHADHMNGDFLMLDADDQSVHYEAHPWCDFEEKRRFKIEQNHNYHLRIVNRMEHIECYVDDVMVLSFCRYRGIGGDMGLFVESGHAVFRNLRLRQLDVIPPQ